MESALSAIPTIPLTLNMDAPNSFVEITVPFASKTLFNAFDAI